MAYAWEKCDLLGLDDQKEILDGICKELGFDNDQQGNVTQNEEALPKEIREENYSEYFEDEAPNDDSKSVHYPLVQDVLDDIKFDEGPIDLSYLPQNDIHDDYWNSFGFPTYDSS